MATVVVQSDKPGQPALLHRLGHVLTHADHVLVANDVAHTTAHHSAFDIALSTARKVMHNLLIANGFR